jgi:RNA polymerase sigma-70 factor, ECF subfamily
MSRLSPSLTTAEAAERDAELLNGLAAGDMNAMSELYDRYAARLLGLALRIVGDRTDAEDVVQEVFAQAWRTAAQYSRARGSAGAWLTIMARTRSLDRLRARRGSEKPLIDGKHREMATSAPPASDDLIAREQAAELRGAVMLLPPEQRRALELAYFEGLSQSQIAAQLQTPLGTVKTHIRGALATLRRSLQR